MFNHLAGLLSLTGGEVPFLGLITSVILWRIKAPTAPYLDDHGRESVNFQISLTCYSCAVWFLDSASHGQGVPHTLSSLLHLGVVAITLVGCISGAVAAKRGEFYRYPMCIRFLG